MRANELTQPPFDTIPLDNFSLVLGNDDSDPRMQQQGSANPSFQALGLDSLPCTSYSFEVSVARQPRATRKAKRFRRRRI